MGKDPEANFTNDPIINSFEANLANDEIIAHNTHLDVSDFV